MRAIVVSRAGGPEVLRIEERPIPEPRPREICVKVHAFGINRADLLQRRGWYPAPPGVPADILGLEYGGEVWASGDGAERFKIGDRVMGLVGGGAYAEYVAAAEDEAVHVPKAWSFTDAAAVPEAFITAYDALKRLRVGKDQWVLIHAVGSGVGTAAMQLVRAFGAHVIGTSRSAAKLERAKDLGLDAALDTSREDFAAGVRRVIGESERGEGGGVDAVLDLVGGAYLPKSLEVLAPRGRLVLVGLTGGRQADLDLGLVLRKRLVIEGTVLRSRSHEEKAGLVHQFEREVLPMLVDGRVRPVVDQTFPFDEVQAAHVVMEQNTNFGKLVVTIGPRGSS